MKKSLNQVTKKQFSRLLLKWNRDRNKRQMPWKGERDPYRIWLSEIILQQTRVEQGLAYYNRFIKAFPGIDDLALATEASVYKLWEGLGYYTRCRNLIATARFISSELQGKFPFTYEAILSLKGIGPYTAAAISSFAFNLPHAVVDGNVFRVLARITGSTIPVDSSKGKTLFTQWANELLDSRRPGIYNQAIMDFGATICKPVAPLCTQCPFNKQCYAFLHGEVAALPVKEKRVRIRKRWFYYLVCSYRGQIAIRLRKQKDIWQGLYEFPMIETEGEQDTKEIMRRAEVVQLIPRSIAAGIHTGERFHQQLSHQLIQGRFIELKLTKRPSQKNDWNWVTSKQLNEYAFPRCINSFLSVNATSKQDRLQQ